MSFSTRTGLPAGEFKSGFRNWPFIGTIPSHCMHGSKLQHGGYLWTLSTAESTKLCGFPWALSVGEVTFTLL